MPWLLRWFAWRKLRKRMLGEPIVHGTRNMHFASESEECPICRT